VRSFPLPGLPPRIRIGPFTSSLVVGALVPIPILPVPSSRTVRKFGAPGFQEDGKGVVFVTVPTTPLPLIAIDAL
jgi:hypothetical protein